MTQKDIIANPRNLKFELLDFGAQPRSLQDLAAAVGYTLDFVQAGIPQEDLIFAPPPPDDFESWLVIGSKWADTDNIKKLVHAFQDSAVQHFLATDPVAKNALLPLSGGQ